jgi:hypothetical protein
MSEDEFGQKDLINFKEMYAVKKRERAVDKAVSAIVGKEIYVNDPRLIKLIAKWKQEDKKTDNPSEAPDNYLENPEKIEELKKTLT